jgi:AmmeMemoRadiSam system protein A/AmmeMemoRadiSam system protein B
MANTSSLVFAGIAPHPPIMVPEVGREAAVEVDTSIAAMAELTARVIRSGAETLILISPHAPLDAKAFVAYDGPQLHADFANFRAPGTTVDVQLDDELLGEICRTSAEHDLPTLRIKGHDLDHGTAVPLYFLQRNGWIGTVVALGYTFLTNEDHLRYGNCIRQAVDKLGRRAAFIASGDLSHRLKPEAPAGYNPQAHRFDEEVVDAFQSGEVNRIIDLDPELRRMAGECGYRSMLVALGVAQGLEQRCEVISYEAPFGVGYLVAQLLAGSADAALDAELPTLARKVVETFVTTNEIFAAPENPSNFLSQRAGCFVSIKTRGGELRGCIGTIDPEKDTLAEEVIFNAISAATRDPRFAPVRQEELSGLKYSVDVLSAPELSRLEDLDPRVYGVIVEDEKGVRRGLLLPNLEGVDTALKQVEIASRKAGIPRNTKIKIWRFRSERHREDR